MLTLRGLQYAALNVTNTAQAQLVAMLAKKDPATPASDMYWASVQEMAAPWR
jgi:hypothetical protein